jgi:H+-transporting ATPase
VQSVQGGSEPGLTTEEAVRRRAVHGPNAVAEERPHPVRLALSKLWAPVPWMLETAIVLQLWLGEYAEATIVAVLLLFNALLGFFQESRAQATLETLKSRLALTASVIRDGSWVVLPAAELVPGDLVTLSLGTVVPADVRVLDGSVLLDQSMLTGESVPVEAGPGIEVYAGAVVRRGQASAEVVAIGAGTRFGRGAELIRIAHVGSTQQKAIFRVVRNLALFNGGVTVLLIGYAFILQLPITQILPLALVAVLASIPVALPFMFTLAATVGARALARRGVLPTRLSALDEAAGIDVLCADKTGTLTLNSLAVGACRPAPGFDAPRVLHLAALASSEAGADPVDAAVRQAAAGTLAAQDLALVSFEPFDPVRKMSGATVETPDGAILTVVKGAYAVIAGLTGESASTARSATGLEEAGFRVLAVGIGTAGALRMAGLIALSDPPRPDSRALVEHLGRLGVRTVMVTGDAPTTAQVIARAVGIDGAISSVTPLPRGADLEHVGVFAGVLPEDKFALVKMLQARGHVVAMCGDGVNDAPALRQAQMGIAVLTATDVAKSAAGIVLTEPGLGGIVTAIEEGRSTFQRILTYTLRSVIQKVVQVLFLFGGLIISGHAIITPVLMVLMMITGDFLALSSSTDRVRPSSSPNVWRIGNLTVASIALGLVDLAFCLGSLLIGRFVLRLDPAALQTLALVTLVFSAQAVFYVSRERRHLWNSRPSRWMVLASITDLSLIVALALGGILMSPLPAGVVASVAVAAVLLAVVLDVVKVALFRRLDIA